jgi:hypothetical protein|tara:strand:- start:54 stop:380 length:327 start_codon:yes stop_codon:yes gene_type:complete
MIGAFIVYTVLPGDWVPSRNNSLIFDDMGYLFGINFILNGLWIMLYLADSTVGFGLALVDMIVLLTTCVILMVQSTTAELNLFEGITLRGGFSVYAGWVTAAMIASAS